MLLHAITLMSTHYHLVVTDTRGLHPVFTRRLNRLFANFTKVHRAWSGEVFNAAGPSVVTLHTPEAVLDKIAYTLANPVAAGAVRKAHEWPGVTTRLEQMGNTSSRVQRPSKYFSENCALPKEVRLSFSIPAALAESGAEATRTALKHALQEHEDTARQQLQRLGWQLLGPRRCLTVSPYKRATAYEVFGSRNPTFATKGSGKRGFLNAVAILRTFRSAYRDALIQWRRGVRKVMFPAGTWLMQVAHGACCTAP